MSELAERMSGPKQTSDASKWASGRANERADKQMVQYPIFQFLIISSLSAVAKAAALKGQNHKVKGRAATATAPKTATAEGAESKAVAAAAAESGAAARSVEEATGRSGTLDRRSIATVFE